MILGPHTVTRLRAVAGQDAYGDDSTSWGTPGEATIAGCSVQPAPGGEFTDQRDAVTTAWNLWAPADADLESTDRVRWGSDTYEIDGQVGVWDFPPLAHKTAFLRRVTG